jgi:hypothetical protein
MFRVARPLLVIFLLLVLLACTPNPQTLPTQTTMVTVAPLAQNTATVQLPPTDTPAQPPTDTPIPATATSTQTPSDTPVPVVATATLPATANPMSLMGSMGILANISQYFNPVGEPLKSWHDVPVMPQATAGQEFTANIYSYTAKATLAQARQFYSSKAASLGLTNPPATGSAGSGSQALHNTAFVSYGLTMVLSSYDNDTGHVIVVISKVP